MTRIEVVTDRKGFRVQVQMLPGMDEMWETLTHFALFKSKARAERLADKIRKTVTLDGPDLNLDHWVWCPSRCSPFAFMQEKPKATLSQEAI